MRSLVSPLLFGLLPLLAVGCVLPERSLGRAEDLGFRPRGANSPRVSTESSTVAKNGVREKVVTDRNDLDRESEQGFHSDATRTVELDHASLTPGHSSDSGKSLESAGWPSTGLGRSPSNPKPEKTIVGKPFLGPFGKKDSQVADSSARSDQKLNEKGQDDSVSESPIHNAAKDKSKLDRSGNMQDPAAADRRSDGPSARSHVANSMDPGNATPGRDRGTDRGAVQPAAAAGVNAKSGGIRQTNQTELALDPSKSSGPALSATGDWSADLEQLIARLEQEVTQSSPGTDVDAQNEHLRKQVHLRLLYMIAQRQEEAMTAIPGTDSNQQEYWQQMVWAMSNSLDTNRYPEAMERAAQTVPPLSAALRQIREQSALSIKNMTFCRKISYFGNYERFPRNDFTAGHEVLLYTEIENFVSSPTAEGEYRTSLKSLIEIADAQGKIVWTKGFPSTEDFCRNPRRDYFHNYQFYIPEDLSTGTYTLKLTIIDELSKKQASNSLNFVLK